jgi:hypothetical protein
MTVYEIIAYDVHLHGRRFISFEFISVFIFATVSLAIMAAAVWVVPRHPLWLWLLCIFLLGFWANSLAALNVLRSVLEANAHSIVTASESNGALAAKAAWLS